MKRLTLLLRGGLALLLTTLAAQAAIQIADSEKIAGIAVGCQAYTFKRFSVFEAIEKTDQAGGRVIEFYPGQMLSPEEPNVRWDHNASPELIAKVQDKLKRHNITAVNYGVVGGRDAAEWRKIFEFAKTLGLYGVTTEDIGKLDIIEPLVKEFDIRLGIHEHAKRADDPSYKIWDPNYVLSLVKDRDPRMGACADTGHWASSGLEPVECVKILKGRIMSLHLKERSRIGSHLPDTVYGRGVCDIKGVLDELKKQGFNGHISIEYENNWDHSVPDVAQCIGFIRGWAVSSGH